MKVICIAGPLNFDLAYVEGIFTQAGMGQSIPSRRDESLTLDFWHQKIQSGIQESAEESAPLELGRVWEQLASDLFIANLEQRVWGWSNSQSLSVLEFWQAFDPQIRFVLVACSVQRYIAHALEAEAAFPSVKVLVQKWAVEHVRMLKFYHQHPQKTLLVDIDRCIDGPAGLLKACEENWKLGLSKVHFPSQSAVQFSAMTRFLSNELSQGDSQWQSLQDELFSSFTPIGTLWKQPTELDINEVVRAYREPSSEAELLRAELTSAERQNTNLTAKNKEALKGSELLLIQLRQVQEELEQSSINLQELQKQKAEDESVRQQFSASAKKVEELQAKLAEAEQQNTTLNAKNKEAIEESELLLIQLHQVQEELEQHFLKLQELQNQKAEDDAARQQSSTSGRKVKELQAKLADAEQQITTLNTKNKEVVEESELIRLELHKVQEELEQQFVKLQELQNQKAEAEQQNTTLTFKNKEVVEESELILLQLHQVQEELEHYFLKYQEFKQLLEDAAQRWQRMLLRVPDYFDLQSAEISALPEASSEALHWCLKGLDAAGRQIAELSLKTFVVGDVACLELPRRMGDEALFQRWPVVAASEETFVVALLDDGATDPKLVQGLLQLGRSDWDLVQLIVSALIKSLDAPSLLRCADGVVIDRTPAALRTLQERLAQVPAAFRFDVVTLKREQVNPDYEHLWFNFRHVSIGEKRLLDFDFRVSCANVRPNSFGGYPKLEFPEASGRAAISGWFDEAYDDFGAKLELRFALPQSMDMAVWGRLTLSDQAFVRQLIGQLPALLSELEGSGVKVKRGWSAWHELAKNMCTICDECTAVVKPKPKRVRVKK